MWDGTLQQCVDPQGEPVGPIPFTWQAVHAAYRWMVKLRAFDQHAMRLQRMGRLGTYPSVLGQEALAVGMGLAMQPEDALCPYYRDFGTLMVRGMPLEAILWYWGGDERGQHVAGAPHDLPLCVPIAGQCLHAVGVARAFQMRREPRVAVASIGDGGTSKGDFYEALNAAGVWELPMVVVVNNNRWAISTPLASQTRVQHLVHKAAAAGIPGVQVDGSDVVAVWHAVSQALDCARSGGGPTLIEALTWRVGDHTTADDASRYREPDERLCHQRDDPVARVRRYGMSQSAWSEEDERALWEGAQRDVEAAEALWSQSACQPAASIWEHLYARVPEALMEQYDTMMQRAVSGDRHA